MSEAILNALMRLFAIMADFDRDNEESSSREVVEMYLNGHLNRQLATEYLNRYDEYSAQLKGKYSNPEDPKRRKRNAAHSVKVLSLCQQINEELHQKEKAIVLLRLIEFVAHSKHYTQNEEDFLTTLSGVFNIDNADFINLKKYILQETIEASDSNYLSISSSTQKISVRQITIEGLSGLIQILKLQCVNLYLLRLQGADTLYLRGQDIKPGLTYVLESGSIIRGNKIKPIYYTAVAAAYMDSEAGEKVIFSASQVRFRFPNSNNGLHRFNLCETSGTLVGIMGGSGVGKSTLFGILNGSLVPQEGAILINGHNIHTEPDAVKGLIGFIPQDDLLFEELTVYENLYYNACLCFKDLNEEQIKEKVINVLSDLGLLEIKDLKVGSPLKKFISGGQRKRLNIALELIREPLILFVDEPTSGLSSNDSEQVMLLLKELTLKDKLIIVNIHQPSSDIYKLFDKLLVMDKGGYVIYNGNPIDAITYFKKIAHHVNADESECLSCGNVNPEQVLQIVDAKLIDEQGHFTRERKIDPTEWFEHYETKNEPSISVDTTKRELRAAEFNAPSRLRQFIIFSKRNLAAKLTNTQYLLLNLLEAPALAVILAFFTKYSAEDMYLFSDNKNFPAFLFMAVIVPLFLGMTVSAEEIIRDVKILQREKFLNLSRFSYLLSKTIFLFFLSAIQTITFVLIANAILGINGMTFYFWLTLFGISFFSNMVGLNISSGLNSVVTIYILIPLILIPQLLLSGVIVKFDDLEKSLTHKKYVPFIGDMMASRWAYEALAVSQFSMNPYQKHFFAAEQKRANASWYTSFIIPELNKTLNIAEININKGLMNESVQNDLQLIRNEINKFSNNFILLPTELDNSFTTPDTNLIISLRNYLNGANRYFQDMQRKGSKEIDSIYNQMVSQSTKQEIGDLKANNYNQAISDMLLNRAELKKIIRDDNELLRRKDPVFAIPDASNGRAHLYAAYKKIGRFEINTFWFNNAVLWLMSIMLFITLQFDVLKKITNFSFKKKAE